MKKPDNVAEILYPWAYSVKALEITVEEYIKEGWKPYGNMEATIAGTVTGVERRFVQAMVKHSDDK